MYDMLKDDAFEYWEKEQQVLFDTLKEKLTIALIRIHLNFDKLFKLYTDTLDIGLKVILA